MENTALILIIVTLFLLVIIVGLLTMMVYKLMKTPVVPAQKARKETGEAPHPDISKSEFHPAILERIKTLEKIKPRKAELFCPNHPEEPGEVSCGICDKIFCKSCIKGFKNMHFCREHVALLMRHEWSEVVTIKTSTTDPEQGVRLYDIKKELFEKQDLPTYIETHYKINVDQDHIETFLVMFAIQEDASKVKDQLKDF